MDCDAKRTSDQECGAAMPLRLRAGGTVRRSRTNLAKHRASERIAEAGAMKRSRAGRSSSRGIGLKITHTRWDLLARARGAVMPRFTKRKEAAWRAASSTMRADYRSSPSRPVDASTVGATGTRTGHVRQAGGDSRLKLRRHGCGGRGWIAVCGRCTARERDRRHGGLCFRRRTAIKPCAFGAPLRGCGA